VIAGFLFEHLQGGVFWVMAAVVLPALFIRPPAVAVSSSR
jgi:PPP family 3-phenylpropionic acid transporter